MKRKLICLLVAAALLLSLCPAALANGWGLKSGRLLAAVSCTHDWDDYTLLGNQAGEYAVLHARYHNALFYADPQGGLHVYTAAAYQPGETAETPSLALNEKDGTLTMVWGGDTFLFESMDQDNEWDMQLREARLDGGRARVYVPQNAAEGTEYVYRYQFTDGAETADFPRHIALENFNISLFPRSVSEVRRLNAMDALLDSGDMCLGYAWGTGYPYSPEDWGESISVRKSGTAPVYAAPDEAAWRAAQGKAAVGLDGEMWHLRSYLNEQGETWACIRYFVSLRTQRIGWVRAETLNLPSLSENGDQPGEQFVSVPVEAAADTYLTDDPDVSQYAHFQIPQGTELTCLGLYNDDYAYVAAYVKDGKISDSGQPVWGFVPKKDLSHVWNNDARRDVMEALAGEWEFWAGGSMADDFLILRADGTFEGWDIDWEHWEGEDSEEYLGPIPGTWFVVDYDPARGLYWNECPYEMIMLYDNGRVNIKGLDVGEEYNSFNLTYWEGGGGYVRKGLDPDTLEPYADEDGNG